MRLCFRLGVDPILLAQRARQSRVDSEACILQPGGAEGETAPDVKENGDPTARAAGECDTDMGQCLTKMGLDLKEERCRTFERLLSEVKRD